MNIEPIGVIHSCFKEKFGIPRQSGLIQSATATLELTPPYNVEDALRGIEEFSHLWIVFAFHESVCEKFQPTVRPPRLGGNTRVGVFATRSPFRPNPIGLSVVELKSVNGTTLELAGGDFLDGTPVLDIKPYIPYVDAIVGATGGFAPEKPQPLLTVTFAPEAEKTLQELSPAAYPNLREVIQGVVEQDPRPAYYDAKKRDASFGFCLWDLNIRWQAQDTGAIITEITR